MGLKETDFPIQEKAENINAANDKKCSVSKQESKDSADDNQVGDLQTEKCLSREQHFTKSCGLFVEVW